MNVDHVINALFNLSFVIEGIEVERLCFETVALPVSPPEQLRWIRTRQQMARDTDIICEAMVVLVRQAGGAQIND